VQNQRLKAAVNKLLSEAQKQGRTDSADAGEMAVENQKLRAAVSRLLQKIQSLSAEGHELEADEDPKHSGRTGRAE
jgi:hypothetical protein